MDGMQKVSLQRLSQIASAEHPGIQDCAVRIDYQSEGQEWIEYLFCSIQAALRALIHHVEIEELTLWGDEGEHDGQIEPYVHYVPMVNMFENLAEAGVGFLVTGTTERATIRLHLVPFCDPSEPLGI